MDQPDVEALRAFEITPSAESIDALPVLRLCIEHRDRAIDKALARWVKRSGLTIRELAVVCGYNVRTQFGGATFGVTVEPHWLGKDEPPAWFHGLR